MRSILVLDQASITTGYSIWNDNTLIKYGHFKVDDSDIGIRLMKIREKVLSLIEDYHITEVYFEDIQLQNNVVNNVQTFKVLAEVFGIIYELATELELPNQAVLAGTWKSALGIKGRDRQAQKQNAQQYVVNTYKIKPTQDECDAICIGQYALTHPIVEESFDWA